MPHQHTRLGSLQRMQAAESVKHRQQCLNGVAIVKGAYIGVAVGLRVNRPSEVVLRTDVGINGRKEAPGSIVFGYFIIVEFQLCPPHLMVMLHGIPHALHGSPTRLCLRLCSIKCQDSNYNFSHTFFCFCSLQRYGPFEEPTIFLGRWKADCLKIIHPYV